MRALSNICQQHPDRPPCALLPLGPFKSHHEESPDEQKHGLHADTAMITLRADPDAESKSRIRDNQRRSRARRREYLESLQERVRDFERRGTTATIEVQRAARRVAAENTSLRALLSRLGVTGEELERFLASFGDDEDDSPRGDGSGGESPAVRLVRRLDAAEAGPSRLPVRLQATDPGLREMSFDQGAELSATDDGESPAYSDSQASGTLPYASTISSTTPGPAGSGSTSPMAMAPPPPQAASWTPMQMSCNAAARIICHTQGSDDLADAKAALGCVCDSECMVRVTDLFNVLEGMGASSAGAPRAV